MVKLRVVELVPNKRVEWECISTHPKSSPASAWTGTHFVFEIVEGDNVVSSGSKHNQDRATALDVPKPVMMTRVNFLDLTTSHGGRYCKT